MTPCQHSRYVMETATDYASAISLFETGNLIDDGFFIVGGATSGEGAVVTRARNHNVDTWSIDLTDTEHGWYRLETNYDHDQPVPAADDRRTPGEERERASREATSSTDTFSRKVTPANSGAISYSVYPPPFRLAPLVAGYENMEALGVDGITDDALLEDVMKQVRER